MTKTAAVKKKKNKAVRKRPPLPATTKAYGLLTFYGVFVEYKDECASLGKNWNEDTQEQYEKVILEKIVPNLSRHNIRPIDDYRKSEFENVIKEIRKSGDYAKASLEKYEHIIRTVVTVAANHGLCRNCFSDYPNERATLPAKRIKTPDNAVPPRSMTPLQERMIRDYLESNWDREGQIAGLWLMFACGLRNAEACGANFESIMPMKSHPDRYVLHIPQTTKGRTNESQIMGKTYNSARMIPLGKDMARKLFDLKENRIQQLRTQGLEIPVIMPIACFRKDYSSRCASGDLTDAARKMFEHIGIGREELDDLERQLIMEATHAEEMMLKEEFGLVEKEPTAYWLRRNFATHLLLLNLSFNEISYLMGHVIEDENTVRSDYRDEKLIEPILKKLDRRPLLNPMDDEVIEYSGGTIEMSTPGKQIIRLPSSGNRIHVLAKAAEPNCAVRVTLKKKGKFIAEYGYSHEQVQEMPSKYLSIDKAYREAYSRMLD